MSHTNNTPARNLSVDQLPRTEQTGSIAYVNDAKGVTQTSFIDNQSMSYHKDGKWFRFENNAEVIPNAPSLWNTEDGVFNDWDPDTGAFNLSAISISDSSNNYGGSGDGIYRWRGFIDMPISNQTIKIFFSYQIKNSLRGGTPVPAIIDAHGWGGTYTDHAANSDYFTNDFAVLSYDWKGTYGGTYSYPSTLMTVYPAALSLLNQTVNAGANSIQDTVTDVTSLKTMDMYYWTSMARRLVSYLRTVSDVNPNKIGFKGYSWGGTLAWNMCSDARIKAVVSWYGVGWINYWRNNPKYIVPYSESTYTDANNRYITGLECQSHAKRAKAPILWLTGTNEYHGQLDRGQGNFDLLPTGINGSFAWEANEPHSAQVNTVQDEILWFRKYLKGENITWYNNVTPVPSLVSNTYPTSGYPMVTITPDASASVVSLSGFYANYNPDQTTRLWLSGAVVNNGNGTWSFEMPSDDIDKWMLGYGLIKYSNGVAVCTKVAAFIPTTLGSARTRVGAYFDPTKATSANLNLWLDANDSSSITYGSGSKVASWTDKSTLANHAIQETDSIRPTLSSIAAGINAVCFNFVTGAGTGLISTSFNTGSYKDHFIVARYDGGTVWNASTGPTYQALFSGGTSQAMVNDSSGSSNGNGILGTLNTTQTPLSTEFWNIGWAANSHYYLNGSLSPVASASTVTSRIALPTINTNAGIINHRCTVSLNLSGYTIGGLKGGYGTWLGPVYEIIAYDSILSTTERQKVEGYLAYKWGLQSVLPPTHPYKSTRPPAT